MNIQKRYIDEATEMIDSWYEAIDQYDNMVNELATALALAENRAANLAAWDGWDLGSLSMIHNVDGDLDKSSNIYNQMISKYGPRPEAK